jgi:hypothetical protein
MDGGVFKNITSPRSRKQTSCDAKVKKAEGLKSIIKRKKAIDRRFEILDIEESFIEASIKWWYDYEQTLRNTCSTPDDKKMLKNTHVYKYVKSRWCDVYGLYNNLETAKHQLESHYSNLDEEQTNLFNLMIKLD